MHDAIDVAEYMLNYCENSLGNPITNLQLQKFLYYVQGVTLALEDRPMFINEIEAWKYGAVIPDVYYWFKDFNKPFKPLIGIKPEKDVLSSNEKNIVNFVAKELIKCDIKDIIDRIKNEDPYKNGYMDSCDNIISVNEMKEYFKNKINK